MSGPGDLGLEGGLAVGRHRPDVDLGWAGAEHLGVEVDRDLLGVADPPGVRPAGRRRAGPGEPQVGRVALRRDRRRVRSRSPASGVADHDGGPRGEPSRRPSAARLGHGTGIHWGRRRQGVSCRSGWTSRTGIVRCSTSAAGFPSCRGRRIGLDRHHRSLRARVRGHARHLKGEVRRAGLGDVDGLGGGPGIWGERRARPGDGQQPAVMKATAAALLRPAMRPPCLQSVGRRKAPAGRVPGRLCEFRRACHSLSDHRGWREEDGCAPSSTACSR